MLPEFDRISEGSGGARRDLLLLADHHRRSQVRLSGCRHHRALERPARWTSTSRRRVNRGPAAGSRMADPARHLHCGRALRRLEHLPDPAKPVDHRPGRPDRQGDPARARSRPLPRVLPAAGRPSDRSARRHRSARPMEAPKRRNTTTHGVRARRRKNWSHQATRHRSHAAGTDSSPTGTTKGSTTSPWR